MITGAPTAITRLTVSLPVPPPFVAFTFTVDVPAAVGVPEISPLDAFTLNPAGKPVAAKLVGEFVAVIWYVNAVPVVPFADVALVTTGAAAAIVIVSVRLPLPALFVAVSEAVVVPAAAGVPEINPVEVFTLRPVGNPVAA